MACNTYHNIETGPLWIGITIYFKDFDIIVNYCKLQSKVTLNPINKNEMYLRKSNTYTYQDNVK